MYVNIYWRRPTAITSVGSLYSPTPSPSQADTGGFDDDHAQALAPAAPPALRRRLPKMVWARRTFVPQGWGRRGMPQSCSPAQRLFRLSNGSDPLTLSR